MMTSSMSKIAVVSLLSLLVVASVGSLAIPALAAGVDTAAFRFTTKCGTSPHGTRTAGVSISVTWSGGSASAVTNSRGVAVVQVPPQTAITWKATYHHGGVVTGRATSGASDVTTRIAVFETTTSSC